MYSVLSLLAALAFLLPCLKQLDDGVLHLQGRIGFWKILAYAPNRPSDSSWGYCETADGAQFEAKFGELTGTLLSSPHVQGYCYTQLTDVGTEKNGLLTENREPKIPLQRLRILNDGK